MNINESVSKLIELVKDQKELLDALNKAFYSKASHITATINGVSYVIPSFLSLENKIDTLAQNFQNIVDAPKTGEAFTHFDGTTQKISLSGFSTTPEQVELNKKDSVFGFQDNNVFKDFMTPNPFIQLNLNTIPDNIKTVNVKKVVLKNDLLKKRVDEISDGNQIKWAELYKILYIYEKNEDYIEYDTIKRLPTRDENSFGSYVIKSIKDNNLDENFDDHYVLEISNVLGDENSANHLVYYTNEGTIQKDIQIGDYLVTSNDKVQMVVEDINRTANTISVRILYGAYANLTDDTSNNPELYKLKYYKPSDFDTNKVINVSLEEDPYICIFVAPINDDTNSQAPWGTGLNVNVYNLELTDGKNIIKFKDWYDRNVNNIGDALYSITSMMSDDSQISKLSKQEFDDIKSFKPSINSKDITVTQINKHLNDSSSVKQIRKLYNQKQQYKAELENIQNSIDNINNTLANISFDDTSNLRSLYTTQLDELVLKRNNINSALITASKEIAESANASEVPIENAKYRIRGFIDVSNKPANAEIIKIQVEYRYKNRNKFTGNAESIGSNIFSDWNIMRSEYRKLIPEFINGHYEYKFEDLKNNENEYSFNQIDIPITQGEVVDIRVKYVYNLGYPFAEMSSGWSEVYSQEFPAEFLTNIEILDILSENNDEIKQNMFQNMLTSKGITSHVDDRIQDQTTIYFHQPQHIASGFYTKENHVISLLDKIQDMDTLIGNLQNEIQGAVSDNLVVTFSDDKNKVTLQPDIVNTFHAQSYSTNTNKVSLSDQDGTSYDVAYSHINLNLYNKGNYTIKFHTMFPGDYNTILNNVTGSRNTKFSYEDYTITNGGVYMQLDELTSYTRQDASATQIRPPALILPTNSIVRKYTAQRLNQMLYFRTKLDNTYLYQMPGTDGVDNDDLVGDNILYSKHPQWGNENIITPYRTSPIRMENNADRFAYVFPYPGRISNICIENGKTFFSLEPGESINIPISFYYYLKDLSDSRGLSMYKVTRTIAFDVRTSLFRDPKIYKINVEANHTDNVSFTVKSQDDLASGNAPIYHAVTK